jgi:hypothetical protein
MKAKLASEDGNDRYAKRRETVEAVFGQINGQQAPAASCAAACVPAPRSGSCCAGPTTCSSCQPATRPATA